MTLRPERIDFDHTWSRLRQTLESVIKVRTVTRNEWTERFTDVYKMCVAIPVPLCDKLYLETKSFIEQHVQQLYGEVCKAESGQLLRVYYDHWINYKRGIDYLNDLYSYLNIQYIKKLKFSEADMYYGCVEINEQNLEIRELGLFFWEKNMIVPLEVQLTRLLLEAIKEDRLGHSTEEKVIYEVVKSLVVVESYKKKTDLYRRILETPFLQATGDYYRLEAERLRQNSDCSQYMERVFQRLQAEKVRCIKFLDSSSHDIIMRECENRMIADHLGFLHGECRDMVLNEQRSDLRNMYSLLRSVKDGLTVLVKETQDHITKIGLDAVSAYLGAASPTESNAALAQDSQAVQLNIETRDYPMQFVQRILSVHNRFSELIEDVFKNDQQFKRALDNAFSTVINHRRSSRQPCRSPELLAKYCDQLLKKSAIKGLSETEIDDKLGNSITVFKYIDDKDVFQKFYSKMLGKRLIHSQSVSMECEESFINKLKQACGHEFTMKLHRMFTDIKVSDDLTRSFSAWCGEDAKARDLGPINFNIFVLQAGAWPLSQSTISPFEIPLPLEKCVSNFEAYYYTRFSGRKLTWLHFLSTCDVKVYLQKKTYLVTMGTYFMAILLLFENSCTLTYANIQESTKLTDDQLLKHLAGLIDAKLLHCDRAFNSEQKPDDLEIKFSLNQAYTNKRTRFKITAVVQKEAQQQQTESEQTHASVDEDRKLYLQAAIVRIMKARKLIKHNQLIQEVIQLSKNRFNPSIPMIKKCIEALIEKQYVERTSANADEYSYVA